MAKHGRAPYLHLQTVYTDCFGSRMLVWGAELRPGERPVSFRVQFNDGSLYEGGWHEDVPEVHHDRGRGGGGVFGGAC